MNDDKEPYSFLPKDIIASAVKFLNENYPIPRCAHEPKYKGWTYKLIHGQRTICKHCGEFYK